MAISKILINSVPQMDVTGTTAVPADVASGKLFTQANGVETAGTGSGGGGNWAWYGADAEAIYNNLQTVKLADTDYATWTPSTTQTTVWTLTPGPFSADFTTYGYALVTRFLFEPVYQAGTTMVNCITRQMKVDRTVRYIYPNSIAAWNAGTKTGLTYVSPNTFNQLFYYNSNGTLTHSSGSSGLTSSASGSGSLSSITWTVNVRAQCNSTYFSTAMASAIDQDASTFTIKTTVYRYPANRSIENGIFDELIDIYQNGIS